MRPLIHAKACANSLTRLCVNPLYFESCGGLKILGFGTGIWRVPESSPRKIRGEPASCGVAPPVGMRVVAAADGGAVWLTGIRVVGAAGLG